MDIFEVIISERTEQTLRRLPKRIVENLMEWILYVKEYGLHETRKITGFNDEKVKGKERKGQRSIRLNKAYRAFYIIDETNFIRFVEVIEVNKHEY